VRTSCKALAVLGEMLAEAQRGSNATARGSMAPHRQRSCNNAELSLAGFAHITNVDISPLKLINENAISAQVLTNYWCGCPPAGAAIQS
jgi:hypothetical protein